jgi:hypothetical protein
MSDVKLRLVTEEDRLAALDEDLAPALAASCERAAVVKHLRARVEYLRGVPLHGYAIRVLTEEADFIERGGHHR